PADRPYHLLHLFLDRGGHRRVADVGVDLVRKLRPMIIGSSSAWLMLDGMMARPRSTSLRTNSGVTKAGTAAPKLSPSARAASARSSCRLRPRFSRSAM